MATTYIAASVKPTWTKESSDLKARHTTRTERSSKISKHWLDSGLGLKARGLVSRLARYKKPDGIILHSKRTQGPTRTSLARLWASAAAKRLIWTALKPTA